jgi:hypothetical protein
MLVPKRVQHGHDKLIVPGRLYAILIITRVIMWTMHVDMHSNTNGVPDIILDVGHRWIYHGSLCKKTEEGTGTNLFLRANTKLDSDEGK